MLLQLPQNPLDFLVGLLGLPGCTGATPGSFGQFLGLVAQLLPDPLQRLPGLPQFLVKHAPPLWGHFTGPVTAIVPNSFWLSEHGRPPGRELHPCVWFGAAG